MRAVIWMSARLGVAARVVVDEDQRGGADVERFPDHFARVDRGFVDRAFLRLVIEDQAVAGVEVEHPHALDRQVRHVDREIVEQRLPAPEDRLPADLAAGHAPGGQRDDLERGGADFAHAGHFGERVVIGVENRGERAETGEERLGGRLGVAARPGGVEQVFEHLVIRQRFRPAFEQPPAQPFAVARAAVPGAWRRAGLISGQVAPLP
jgi:hypothetical protein